MSSTRSSLFQLFHFVRGGMVRVSLPPANEVCKGYVFTPVCQSFCSQGVSAPVHAGIHIPPWTRGRHHPRTRGRHPPHPLDRRQTPPGSEANPPAPPPHQQCMLGDTGNKRAVRILLECILVRNAVKKSSFSSKSFKNNFAKNQQLDS